MLYLFLALMLAAADQCTKALTVNFIELGGAVDVIPGVVGLTHTRNTGMAFSMWSNSGWILTAVTGVLIVIVIIVLFAAKLNTFERISLAMVLGGAVGNGVDRLLYGYVLDMVEVQFVNFAVFNFADSCIVVGCILFLIGYIFFHNRGKNNNETMAELERLNSEKREAQK